MTMNGLLVTGGVLTRIELRSRDDEDQFAKAANFRFDGQERYRSHRSHYEELPFEKLKLPRIEGQHHFVAYKPELWAGVVEMVQTLNRIKAQVETLLDSHDGIAEIERVGRERTPLRLTAST